MKLALAGELPNISRACKVAGISRTHFYEIKEPFERYGRDGLVPQSRRRPWMPNQMPPELEAQILRLARVPTTSQVKIADQLKLGGVPATAKPGAGRVAVVTSVLKAYDRLLWLERETAASGGR